MAQTITTSSPRALAQIATGRYLDTGTVAAYTFTLGFRPRYVKVMNVDGLCMMEWFEGMAAASAVKTVDSGSNATDVVKITSHGITVSDTGFIMGLDTDVNVTNEQVSFLALA
jgi:hypothetical protein